MVCLTGSWNDADMMMVCAFGKGQVPGGGMTLNEYRAHYAVWAILASALIHGCDLRTVRTEHPQCWELITNPEIIKVNQDPAALSAQLIYQEPSFPRASTGEITQQIFARPLSGPGNRTAVLLLNRAPVPLRMHVSWAQLGLEAAAAAAGTASSKVVRVYDVLQQANLSGTFSNGYDVKVPSHDVAFIIVTM